MTFPVSGKQLASKPYVDQKVAAIPAGPAGPSTYDFHNFINGKPLAQEILIHAVALRPTKILAGCPGSYAFCSVAPSLSFDIAILKNGIQVGTINFAVNATSGTFSLNSDLTLNPGEQLAVRCVPASQDATFSDPVIAIKADTF